MIEGITIGDITIDSRQPAILRDFYADLTGWERRVLYNCPALLSDRGLAILFNVCNLDYVPPVWPEEPDKQQKQMHFDFQVDNLHEAVQEAVRLGARRTDVQFGGDLFTTLLDPEGHPFCLCKRQSESEISMWFQQRGYSTIPNPSINIDCPDTRTLREFYAELTGWDREFHWTALVADNGMVVHFMQCDFDYIPPVWPEEATKQQKQMHINFQVDDLPSAVEHAIRLGATKAAAQYGGQHFMTMFDPVGHPFCLCRK